MKDAPRNATRNSPNKSAPSSIHLKSFEFPRHSPRRVNNTCCSPPPIVANQEPTKCQTSARLPSLNSCASASFSQLLCLGASRKVARRKVARGTGVKRKVATSAMIDP